MLTLPVFLSGACRDCAPTGFGGPSENRFTAYDAICRDAACRDAGFPQVFVSTANLTLFVRVTDLVFGGPAPALALEQSFNMDDMRTGALGAGWSFSLGDSLTPASDGSVVLRRGTGRIDRFAIAPGASAYFAITKTLDTLSQAADGTYRLRSAGSNTVWSFRPDGKLASIQDGAIVRIALSYDAAGGLSTGVYRGRMIQFTTDSQGRMVKIADGASRTVIFTYSDDGRLTGQSNADGSTIRYEYDAAGSLISLTYAGGKYAIAYTGEAPNLCVASVTTPDGATRVYDIPRSPNEIRVTDGNGDAWLYTSTAQGLLQSVRDPAGNGTAYTYDIAGNRTSVTNPAGETATFTYDSAGNLMAVTDPANNRWTADYTGGQLIRITDPRRSVWTLQYDDSGNLTGVTDPLSGATSATRNAAGQIVSISDAAGNKSTYQYGADTLLAGYTDALGNKMNFSYDGAARPSTRLDSGGRSLNIAYTALNRIAGLSAGDATATFDYSGIQRDATGRLASYSDSYGNSISYHYDPAGQLSALTLPGGKTVTYQYDRLHRLSAVSDWAGTTALYRYDAAGYPLSLSIAGGPATIWQYDGARNLRAIVSTGPDGTPVAGYRYTFDASGNRVTVSALEPYADAVPLPAFRYGYDTANRPASRSDGQNYRYDAPGNLIEISGSRAAKFNYDPFGRLIGLAGDTTTTYGYDSTGLLTLRNDRRYIWDPSGTRPRLVMESDSSGNPIAWYVYGIGLLWKVAADGTAYFYHFDGDGNVVAISNSAGVLAQYRYDAAGNLLAANENNVENLFRAGGASGWIGDGDGLLFTGAEFRFPELRLTLPAAADSSPVLPGLRPQLHGAGACFLEGVASCAFANGRDR